MTVFANLEAERAILGACLLYGRIMVPRLHDAGITPDHFLDPTTRLVYDAVIAVYDESGNVDAGSVGSRLGTPEKALYVDHLSAEAGQPETIRSLVKTLKRTRERATWQDAAYALLEAADEDDERHVERAERILKSDAPLEDDEWTPARLQQDVYGWLSSEQPAGISTGFPGIDRCIGGGLRPGDVTALGGWTGMGKSLVADQILSAVCAAGRKGHLFINEMSPRDRALRLIAQAGAAPYPRLVVKDLDGRELERTLKASGEIPFGITEISSWPVEKLARTIRRGGWDVCVIDVLHNMPFKDVRDLDLACSILLGAALSSGTHLVWVCHLNDARAVGSTLPPPVLRDIRNSGMIQRIAANVMMVHRSQADSGGFVTTGLDGSLEVLKARHGSLGGTAIRLDVDSLRFVGLEPPVRAVG